MDEIGTMLLQAAKDHGWPTAILIFLAFTSFVVLRWLAPRVDGWITKVVTDHCLLICSLRQAVDSIRDSLLAIRESMGASRTKYDLDAASHAQLLSRLDHKIDNIREDIAEIKGDIKHA